MLPPKIAYHKLRVFFLQTLLHVQQSLTLIWNVQSHFLHDFRLANKLIDDWIKIGDDVLSDWMTNQHRNQQRYGRDASIKIVYRTRDC